MTIITKAALAAELRVSKSRVSQYVAAGLPQREDGKLDREAALMWIGRNQRSGNDHKKGAAQARKLKPAAPGATRLDPFTLLYACKFLLLKARFYAAHTAVDAGTSLETAYAVSEEMHLCMLDAAREALGKVGFPHFELSGEEEAASHPAWEILANRTGDPVDLAAWKAHLEHLRANVRG